ncbi:MAG: hypothetical protein MJK18_06140, partial [Bdellovibrionales bacterium]|nr:hypothetical protein [Bdellovibrionales bacterium]
MSTKTLFYSHSLEREDTFFSELEQQGFELRYLVNVNKGPSPLVTDSSRPLIVHEIYDLRRGIFPKEISDKAQYVIDQDVLEFFEPHLFDLLSMCSRMDADGFSFSFEQRWSLIKTLITHWEAVL